MALQIAVQIAYCLHYVKIKTHSVMRMIPY
jgi:hypothetical protein